MDLVTNLEENLTSMQQKLNLKWTLLNNLVNHACKCQNLTFSYRSKDLSQENTIWF